MAYDLYPAVDENYNFPPEIRAALAKSEELKSLVVPMTNVERNNLVGDELWDGRLIVNTTTKKIERYDLSTGVWSQGSEEVNGIFPMTEASRDNLSGPLLTNGRVIYNTTTNRLDRYNEALGAWVSIIDESTSELILDSTGTPEVVKAVSDRGSSSFAARADHSHGIGDVQTVDIFTSDGTWTKPEGVKSVVVEMWGGGAGGQARVSTSTSDKEKGGSGGGYAKVEFDPANLGASEIVMVGQGGAGATTTGGMVDDGRTAGGSSSFAGVQVTGGGLLDGGGPFGERPNDSVKPGLWGGAAGVTGTPSQTYFGGGAGGGSYYHTNNLQPAENGPRAYSTGTAWRGGNGGAGAVGGAGEAPGGGGGSARVESGTAYGGSGARGEVRITSYF